MPIIVLADDVAAKIAAGEVIERPVSVVKELVENALDAGATDIRVEIREGGQRLIRVADNGSGIPAAEVETAFQRHATSKVRSADDLFRISTLGFRGEALPSVAAVSRVTLVTRTREETVGTRLRLDAGRVVERVSVGAPAGTVLTVENLFYNTPARLKFLKSNTAEAGQVHTLIQHLALAYPDRRLALVSDGRTVFQHTGGALRDSLTTIYGAETARQMIEVEGEQGSRGAGEQGSGEAEEQGSGGVGEWGSDDAAQSPSPLSPPLPVGVQGYVSPPAISRANRAHMTFIVNGRWVQDRSLQIAVTEAYHTLLMVGRFPLTILHITLAPDEVDVNVHPAKAEVRFRDGRAVFSAVQQTVRRALIRHAPIPQFGWAGDDGRKTMDDQLTTTSMWQTGINWWQAETDSAIPNEFQSSTWDQEKLGDVPSNASMFQFADENEEFVHRPSPALHNGGSIVGPTKLPMLRVVGQIGQSYIIAEGPDGMYLIDQHAAHERVLYEQFLAAHARSEVGRQALLSPLPLDLDPTELGVIAEHLDNLNHLGFTLEPFGSNTILVRAVPSLFKQTDPRPALRDILAQVGEGKRNPMEVDTEAMLLRAVCKTAAIKAGQTLSMPEMQALIRQLEASSSPRTCPHGRPTMIHLSGAFLAREFGRR